RKDVEAPKAAEQKEACAPGADAGQLDQGAHRVFAAHREELVAAEVARFDGARGVAERFRLLAAEAAAADGVEPGGGDHGGSRERVVPAALVLERLAEALDEAPHERDAGVEAHLLKGDDAREGLEELAEARRAHAAQRERGGAERAL